MSSTEKAQVFWQQNADGYDKRSAWLEKRALADGRAWACSRALGETLDIGIGTGTNIDHYPTDITLHGVDWSQAMVDLAMQRAAARGIPAHLRQADAQALPYADNSFDTVISTYVMCCVPDERAALAEAVRVLKPGGRLLLADHVISTRAPARALQRTIEFFASRSNGERLTRRPSTIALSLPGQHRVDGTRGERWGIIECLHAELGSIEQHCG